MLVKPIKTRIFKQGESLVDFVTSNLATLKNRSIIVITSKIVSLAENRVVKPDSKHTEEDIIKEESQWAMRTKYTWLTIKDNMVMSKAGIDKSNSLDGSIILLPEKCYETARKLRRALMRKYKLTELGVLITDSRRYPLRVGVVGVALGYAGFKGFKNYKGKKDLFGRALKFSRVNMADSLATSAIITMGEGDESQPLAVITDSPVKFTSRVNSHELELDIKEDIYQPLFEKIKRIKF